MSVRSLTASISSCRIRATPLLIALQEPTPGKEEPLVRPKSVPVRHAGDVVSHAGGQVSRGSLMLGGKLVRMFQVVLEQIPKQLDGLVVILVRAFPEVDLGEHEVAEIVQRPERGRRQADVGLPVALLDQ